MSKIQAETPNELGIQFSGNSEDGHCLHLNARDALEKIFGTEEPIMAEGLMRHCFRVLKAVEASEDHPGNDERAFMFAAINEIAPRDGVERLLAVQMVATHIALTRSGALLAASQTVDQVKAHYSGFNKLTRAYTAQMEALRKHRNGGKQTVTVQHVNVSDGGQAIVGNVETGGRGKDKK